MTASASSAICRNIDASRRARPGGRSRVQSSAQSKTRNRRPRVARQCHGRLQTVGPASSVWSARIRRSRVTSISSAGRARCPGTSVVLLMMRRPASSLAWTPPPNPRRNSRGPVRPMLRESFGGSMNVTATPCSSAQRVKACSRLIAGFHVLFEQRVIAVMTRPRPLARPAAPGPTGPTTTRHRGAPPPLRPRPTSPRRCTLTRASATAQIVRGTAHPVVPSMIVSGRPPSSLTMTGHPLACASMLTRPNGSAWAR